ncbi:MAG: molybdopterin-synthase adenylyltransferase MoeB [Chloroflexi bacterium]|nr:MAG: molybdopterin-synthase adenylyltransferase MoeB [Chloroflexota bacterium]
MELREPDGRNRHMPVTVYIPTPFRRFAGNQTYVKADGKTVGEVLESLGGQYPSLRQMIYDASDEIPGHINIYVNSQEIHSLQGKLTPVKDGDEMAVIPAIAGGQVLTPEQVNRYSRHIIMPQVGPAGQRKLMETEVLVVGAGGLGGPAALYLALAGIGTIGIIDFDVVDLSNLQRQVLHQTEDVGKPKTESAKETLRAYNPDVNVVIHNTPITSDNAMEIIPQYDMVVNGADNFTTRYLVNDACYFAGKTLVDGSILLFDGQATVFVPGHGCYRCLFPAPPPPGLVPNCAEAGVLGALTGVMGSIQAIEVIKQVLGIGESLVSRLLLFDALAMDFRIVKLRRDPKCPLCGDNPTIKELIDYEGFCGAPFPGQDHDGPDGSVGA